MELGFLFHAILNSFGCIGLWLWLRMKNGRDLPDWDGRWSIVTINNISWLLLLNGIVNHPLLQRNDSFPWARRRGILGEGPLRKLQLYRPTMYHKTNRDNVRDKYRATQFQFFINSGRERTVDSIPRDVPQIFCLILILITVYLQYSHGSFYSLW